MAGPPEDNGSAPRSQAPLALALFLLLALTTLSPLCKLAPTAGVSQRLLASLGLSAPVGVQWLLFVGGGICVLLLQVLVLRHLTRSAARDPASRLGRLLGSPITMAVALLGLFVCMWVIYRIRPSRERPVAWPGSDVLRAWAA